MNRKFYLNLAFASVAAIAVGGFIVHSLQAEQPQVQGLEGFEIEDVEISDEEMGQISYLIGRSIAEELLEGFRQQGAKDMGIELEQVIEGIEAGLHDKPSLIDDDQAAELMQKFQQRMFAVQLEQLQREQQAEQQQAPSAAQETQAFLERNKAREEVQTTASGLQYEIIEEGEGASPGATDRVTVHYTGSLIDGQVFDSSVQRGEPATFALNQVIPGWTEALQKMKPGSKWRLYIPPDLAYGAQGRPPVIPPNAALIFDVELIDVE